MKKASIALLLAFLLAACGSSTAVQQPTAPSIVVATSTDEPAEITVPVEEASPSEESINGEDTATEAMQGPDCLGPEVNEIGQGIADRFDTTNYEEVMTWFCNGAEFEDILLALQSEQQSDASAEEMLVMLADGFSWDEIWLLVGITE